MNGNGRKNEILMSAFVAVESAHAYSAVLPSIFTIRAFCQDERAKRAIRDGEIVGTLFAVGLGGIVSALIGSKLPFLFSLGTSAVMIVIYEYALRTANGNPHDAVEPGRLAPVWFREEQPQRIAAEPRSNPWSYRVIDVAREDA